MNKNWEHAVCAICLTDEFSTERHHFGETGYWLCHKCGLVYLSPRPKEEVSPEIYDSKDYFEGNGSGYLDYEGDADSYYRTFARRVQYIKRFQSSGSLLDIGCGTGLFLEVASKAGFDVMGVDVSSHAVERAGRRLPNKVILGTIEHPQLQPMKFDVITMFDLFEHVYRPHDFLTRVAAILEDDGIVVITTPNYQSVIRKCLGNRTVSFKPPEHVYYYSKRTIALVAQHCLEINDDKSDGQYCTMRFLESRIDKIHPSLGRVFRFSVRMCTASSWNVFVPSGSITVVLQKKLSSASS